MTASTAIAVGAVSTTLVVRAARPAQFYDPMHWDIVRPHLIERLGEN
jgi:hypothetical protein